MFVLVRERHAIENIGVNHKLITRVVWGIYLILTYSVCLHYKFTKLQQLMWAPKFETISYARVQLISFKFLQSYEMS